MIKFNEWLKIRENKKWFDVRGTFSLELFLDKDGKIHNSQTGKLEIPEVQDLIHLIDPDGSELIIHFTDQGHSIEKDYLNPPEWHNERMYAGAELDHKQLPNNLGKKLFDSLKDRIDEVELDKSEYYGH